MLDRDFLWCALHMLLDDEEEAARMCPACRAQAEQGGCPVCGAAEGAWQEEENESFDMERFLRMKEGEGQ